jgi:hypothetical protein
MLPGYDDVRAAGRPGANDPELRRRLTPWRERIGAAALAALVFAGHLWLALRLDALGLFERFNTLFGADPNLRLESLRRSDALFRVPHPGLSYLLGIPVRALGRAAAAVLPGDPAPDQVVRSIALGVAPLASALTCLILLRLFRRLGFSFAAAFALTLLSAVSMSAIVFGSMPETYAVSALAIALACALFLRSRERRGFGAELGWLGVGVLAAGVTITNIAPVAVLYYFRGVHRGDRAGVALARTVGIALLAVFVACAAGLAADRFLRVRRAPGPSEREWISRYIVEEPGLYYATFPTAIANGIASPTPTRAPGFAMEARRKAGAGRRKAAVAAPPKASEGATLPDSTAAAADRSPSRAPGSGLARLTLQPSHRVFSGRNFFGAVLVAALVWAALRRPGANPALASLARASLVIVGLNWALHGFWGDETFLYSLHWHVPLMLLLAALLVALGRGRRAPVVVLAAAALAVAASNAVVLARALSAFTGP